jgi:hypothetical protein
MGEKTYQYALVEGECQLYNHIRRLEAASIDPLDPANRLNEVGQLPFELSLNVGKRRIGHYKVDITRK